MILFEHSYKILCPHLVKEPIKPEKATEVIIQHIDLPSDQFRLGKTKVSSAITADAKCCMYL